MDKLATMDTIGSSFRPWLSCQGICLLNRHQTGETDSVQPVILLPVQRDSQETFIPCEARMLWYSADRTSSQQLRDTTRPFQAATKPDKLSDQGNERQRALGHRVSLPSRRCCRDAPDKRSRGCPLCGRGGAGYTRVARGRGTDRRPAWCTT